MASNGYVTEGCRSGRPVREVVGDAAGPLPLADGLMAATALTYRWQFATRKVKHVERTGVELINPFE